MAHRNAPLTPEGRRRLCERVDAGRPICHVAAEAGIARQTLAKWHARWEADGEAGLVDRSSRPAAARPGRPGGRGRGRVAAAGMKLGPVMLVPELAEFGITLAASTIHRVLVRRGISRLRDLDVTGEACAAAGPRYEHRAAGDLVHLDVKKLGRIPTAAAGGPTAAAPTRHRAPKRGHGPATSTCTPRSMTAPGWPTPRNSPTRKPSPQPVSGRAPGVLRRPRHRGHRRGPDRQRLRLPSAASTTPWATGTKHRYTRPYRPQTNGKVERFHRTLAREWAYQRSWTANQERSDALPASCTATTTIDPTPHYGHHRPPHPPVTNLSGFNT